MHKKIARYLRVHEFFSELPTSEVDGVDSFAVETRRVLNENRSLNEINIGSGSIIDLR